MADIAGEEDYFGGAGETGSEREPLVEAEERGVQPAFDFGFADQATPDQAEVTRDVVEDQDFATADQLDSVESTVGDEDQPQVTSAPLPTKEMEPETVAENSSTDFWSAEETRPEDDEGVTISSDSASFFEAESEPSSINQVEREPDEIGDLPTTVPINVAFAALGDTLQADIEARKQQLQQHLDGLYQQRAEIKERLTAFDSVAHVDVG